MNKNIEKEKGTEKNSEVTDFNVNRLNDFESIEIRLNHPLEKSNQNMISVEQFDKAGQQISSISGNLTLDSDQKNSNKLKKMDDEFNHSGHHFHNQKVNNIKGFLSNYHQVEEIEPGIFEVTFDLDTKEAGADYAIIDNIRLELVCDEYNISLEHNLDITNLDRRMMYALRKQEENTLIIRQILKHFDDLNPLIEDIFNYFIICGNKK